MKKNVFLLILVFLISVNISYAVPDDDQDGVPNAEDQCPNSDTTEVDQFGCSCSQKTCPSDNNVCTNDCSVVNGLPTCGSVNNRKPCNNGGGYCSGGSCVPCGGSGEPCCPTTPATPPCLGSLICSSGTCQPPGGSGSCTDSDGGKEYYVRGTLNFNNRETYTDFCNIRGQLNEMYCVFNKTKWVRYNTGYTSTEYNCPNGCQDGACLRSGSNTTPICTDSDGGKNYYEKGYLTYERGDGAGMSGYESCDGSQVVETYCREDGSWGEERFFCENGCQDGACLGSPTQQCADTDGGNDYLNYGECTGKNGVKKDKCRGWLSNKLSEYSCNQGECEETRINCKTEYDRSYACKKGACITCTDSDGGKEYEEYGEVTDKKGRFREDRCNGSGKKVIEFSCKPNGKYKRTSVNCRKKFGDGFACEDGACVQSGSPVQFQFLKT
ncbi:hypothetical protein CMO83_04245 [Candidatus Woesearchaeota archaeon]|nr:hypothetical protein [Candidatus Woesearchaeota archaeon]